MRTADVEPLLVHLAELLAGKVPDHARGIDDDRVSRWAGPLRTVAVDEARTVIAALAEGWDHPYFPGPAEFQFVRRDLTCRRHIAEARAAVAKAPDRRF